MNMCDEHEVVCFVDTYIVCCGLVRVEVTRRGKFKVRSGEGWDDGQGEVGSDQVKSQATRGLQNAWSGHYRDGQGSKCWQAVVLTETCNG